MFECETERMRNGIGASGEAAGGAIGSRPKSGPGHERLSSRRPGPVRNVPKAATASLRRRPCFDCRMGRATDRNSFQKDAERRFPHPRNGLGRRLTDMLDWCHANVAGA